MFDRPINRWWTVLAGGMGCAAGAGVVATYVFGIFIKAIAAEYGWDRSATTLSISCFYFVSGIGSVVLGSLLARYSLRWMTLAWVVLFSFSVAAISILPPSVPLFCLAFAVMGFFGAAATAMPYGVAISGWFDRNRGLALAIAVSGTGVAGAFMSRYANWLMSNFGWRGGYVGVALFCRRRRGERTIVLLPRAAASGRGTSCGTRPDALGTVYAASHLLADLRPNLHDLLRAGRDDYQSRADPDRSRG